MSSSKRGVVKCVCDAIRLYNQNSTSSMQDLLAPSLDRTLSSVSNDMHPRTAEIAVSLACASLDDEETSKFGTWLPRSFVSPVISVDISDLAIECVRLCPSLMLDALSTMRGIEIGGLDNNDRLSIEAVIRLMKSDRLLDILRGSPELEIALYKFYYRHCEESMMWTMGEFCMECRLLYNYDPGLPLTRDELKKKRHSFLKPLSEDQLKKVTVVRYVVG